MRGFYVVPSWLVFQMISTRLKNINKKKRNKMKKVVKIIIQIIKHTLALPTYPFFAIIWILRQVIAGIDFVLLQYIKLLKIAIPNKKY